VVYDIFTVADMVSATSGGTFSGNVTFNGDISVGDDVSLASDGAVLGFGADNEITVTHVADKGLIVKSGSSGATAPTFCDDLVVEMGSYNGGISILTGGTNNARICFGDDDDNDVGQFNYDHSNDRLTIQTGAKVNAMFESGRVSLGEDATPNSSAMVRCDTNESDEQAFTIHASHASFATEAMNIFSTRTGSTDFSFMKMHSNNNNDVEFNFKGEGTVNSDGTNNLGSGADYAEYFEWKDRNSSNEDRVGYSVILDGNQIVKATSSDDTSKIIGVISGNPAVVGDTAWNKWSKKHLKDDYGRYIMEEYSITEWYESDDKQKTLIQYMTDEIPSDVKVPSDATVLSTEVDGKTKLKRRKVNPDWDKSKTYIPREDRKEWDVVGLTGKLRLRKGQPTGDRWIKMRDISDTVEEWLVR